MSRLCYYFQLVKMTTVLVFLLTILPLLSSCQASTNTPLMSSVVSSSGVIDKEYDRTSAPLPLPNVDAAREREGSANSISASPSSPSAVSSSSSSQPSESLIEIDTKTKVGKRIKEASDNNRMPSLFIMPQEAKLDRYAACLAATEGLRKMRDAVIEKSRRGHRHGSGIWSRLVGTAGGKRGFDKDDPLYRRASAEYVINSSRIVRALGLSVAQFNQIGRELSADPELKEKVLEQAYLYRITATLNMEKVPILEDPSSEELLRAHKRRRVQMFARSMCEIEELRQEQTDKLLHALKIERLPRHINICDPDVLPLLSPKVRAVCEAFPLQAQEIVRKYGLNSDEFNKMLEETKGNPIFRWRIKKYMDRSKMEKSSRMQ